MQAKNNVKVKARSGIKTKNSMLLKFFIFVLLLLPVFCLLSSVSFAQPSLPPELISIHTAYVPLRGDLATDFRVYGNGGMLAKVRLGIIDWLTFGLSLSVDGVIGSGICEIVKGNPGVIAKFRLFDEMTSKNWPTISIGYDNSKYGWVMGKGFYGVASKEFPVGKMFTHVHGGMNYIGEKSPNIFMAGDVFFTHQICLAIEMETMYKYKYEGNNVRIDGDYRIRYNFGFLYIPVSNLKIGLFFCCPVGEPMTREMHISYIAKLF